MRARTAAEQERVEWRKEPVARRQKGTDFLASRLNLRECLTGESP